jgi:hypothetical protein
LRKPLASTLSSTRTQRPARAFGSGDLQGPAAFPAPVFALVDACRDSGLWSELIAPDYALLLGYPPGAVFRPRSDSRFRWGEVVTGASLGAPSLLTMYPTDSSQPCASRSRAGRSTR